MVSRVQAVARAATVWTPGTVPYSQARNHQPDGYRQDCSGYVSMCWGLAAPGESTVTLVTKGLMAEVPAGQLQPGDAIGLCGPGTAGNAGHIQLVEAVTATGLVIWEQAGGTAGPTRRTIKRPTPGYKAYRLATIDTPSTVEDDMAALFLVSAPGDPAVWLSNGIQRRGVHNEAEIKGWLMLGARRFENVDLSWYGDPVPAGGAGAHTHALGPATPVE